MRPGQWGRIRLLFGLPPIGCHGLALLQHMALHCLLQICERGSCRQIQHPVQTIDTEEISLRLSARRTRTGISDLSEVVFALHGNEGLFDGSFLGDGLWYDICRRDIPDKPVSESSIRRIRIIDNHGQ